MYLRARSGSVLNTGSVVSMTLSPKARGTTVATCLAAMFSTCSTLIPSWSATSRAASLSGRASSSPGMLTLTFFIRAKIAAPLATARCGSCSLASSPNRSFSVCAMAGVMVMPPTRSTSSNRSTPFSRAVAIVRSVISMVRSSSSEVSSPRCSLVSSSWTTEPSNRTLCLRDWVALSAFFSCSAEVARSCMNCSSPPGSRPGYCSAKPRSRKSMIVLSQSAPPR